MRVKKSILLMVVVFLLTILLGFYREDIDGWFAKYPLWYQLVSYEDEHGQVNVEEQLPLEYLYVTILENDPQFGYSFQEMSDLSQADSQEKDPYLPVILQAGSSSGPEEGMLGYGGSKANATIEQRGNSVRWYDLKSYKIRLDDGNDLWRQQRIINLNKHPADHTRIRNKLSFDYMSKIGYFNFDTQFVQLFVKDLTKDPQSQEFEDYGLFTHVEQPNKNFRSRNGLDEDGYFYKAINFEFHRYPDQLKSRNDPSFQIEDFDSVLRVVGRDYHEKLLSMLEDVNDETLDFDRVFERHFNKDNFLTWISINLLMGNLDTTGNNFYIYSSRYTDQWLFVPWDYDRAWNYDWQWGSSGSSVHPTREGLSLYWGWPLAKRFLQNPENVQALNEKMEELASIMSEEQTQTFLDDYLKVVRPMIFQQPDVQLLPDDLERFDEEYNSFAGIAQQNLKKYYLELEKPMPIFTGGPWYEGDLMTFTWDESYDLQGDDIYYDLTISTTLEFDSYIYQQIGIQDKKWSTDVGLFPAGDYYWRLIIRDSQGHEQVPFESYVDENKKYYHGIKVFTVE